MKAMSTKTSFYFYKKTPLIFFCWVLLCLSSSVLLDHSLSFKILFVTTLALATVRPVLAIVVFLILMPWLGGSQPGYLHTIRFIQLYAALIIGIIVNLIKTNKNDQINRSSTFDWSNPLVFGFLVYWIVTGLSLTSVPTSQLLKALVWIHPEIAQQFIGQYEVSATYPWLSFVILSMSFVLFIYLFVLFRENSNTLPKMIGAICVGAIITVFVGLLDYYDIINLKFARPSNFEEVYGVYYRFQHLTSIFGNPGWLAQYLTLSAPAMISILFLPFAKKKLTFLLILVMILTEWCIILVYQRGGWLSYPLTLLIIWFCVYSIHLKNNKDFDFKKAIISSAYKIAISIPITVIISLTIALGVAKLQPEYRQGIDGFTERALSIKNTNDRMAFWTPTYKIFIQHPILGGGVDSFMYQYEKSFMRDGHKCIHDDPYTTNGRGSAHNLYFQTLAGKGVLGLASLVGIIFSALFLIYRGVFRSSPQLLSKTSQNDATILLTGFAYICALVIYSNVGEIFYFPLSYILFVTFIASIASAGQGLARLTLFSRLIVILILFVCLIAHLLLERYGGLSCF